MLEEMSWVLSKTSNIKVLSIYTVTIIIGDASLSNR